MRPARVHPARAQTHAPEDDVLLARVAEGDLSALGALYDRHAPSLVRFARSLEPEGAEDIVQTVFMRVIRVAGTFRGGATSSARSWLFGITVRVARERGRSLRRLGAALLRMAHQPPRSAPAILDTRPDIDAALMRLSETKRTVVLLAEVAGLSGEEIASILDIPVGTVWTRLHHARRDLRRFTEEADR
jgi:RNA polymerase sigma factor (sigma-70 family)